MSAELQSDNFDHDPQRPITALNLLGELDGRVLKDGLSKIPDMPNDIPTALAAIHANQPALAEIFTDSRFWIDHPKHRGKLIRRAAIQGFVTPKDENTNSRHKISLLFTQTIARYFEDDLLPGSNIPGGGVSKYLTPREALQLTWVLTWGLGTVFGKNYKIATPPNEGGGITRNTKRPFRNSIPTYKQLIRSGAAGVYVSETRKIPLLTPEEEVQTFIEIEAGKNATRELKSATKTQTLDPETTKGLSNMVEQGDAARVRMIKANQRLVINIVTRYIDKGVPFLDLVQEGNLGLLRAIEKFDYKKGKKFSTYATWWIRQSAYRALADQGRTIRIPVHESDRLNNVYRYIHYFRQKNHRNPTLEEIAIHFDRPVEKIEKLLRVDNIISLDALQDTDENDLYEIVKDKKAKAPADFANEALIQKKVGVVLAQFDVLERLIIMLRHGFDGGGERTQREVADILGFSREWVRIRENKVKEIIKETYPELENLLED